MSVSIPTGVREKVFAIVYSEADKHQYLHKSRPENARFMEALIKHAKVGGVLKEYMAEDQVRRYIKDAVLNKYSKLRRAQPRDITVELSALYKGKVLEISYDSSKTVSLHRLENDSIVVAARSSYSTWETGLRKLLLFVAAAPGLPPKDTNMELVLVMLQHGNPINQSDKKLTVDGLRLAGIKCAWRP